MKRTFLKILSALSAFVVLGAVLFVSSCTTSNNVRKVAEGAYMTEDGTIFVDVPERPAGQKDVLGLVTEKLETVRVGFIGVGMRGSSAVQRYSYLPGTEIKAICDVVPENVERSVKWLEGRDIKGVATYSEDEEAWKKLCERDDIDLVYICTDWLHHVPMAVYAMEHGKHVAIEVPAANTLDDIWQLINTSERTRKHCMMLENCVYDFFEMTALNMAQQGLFGEIIHCQGAYCHCLEPFWPAYWNNWRLDFNKKYRGDVYPTHGLGPVCQALNIHRGDRLKTLVSMDTKAFSGSKVMEKLGYGTCDDFQNGDLTMTMMKTEKGKTILIEHDVMTPRPYDRMYQLVGTKGYAGKYPIPQFTISTDNVDKKAVSCDDISGHGPVNDEVRAQLMERYRSPILTQELEETAKKVGGHGGMDFIMDYRLIYCLRNGLPLDMDVYDLAEWCCLGDLTRLSLENGCAPVEIPDFTRGAWNKIDGFSYAMK